MNVAERRLVCERCGAAFGCTRDDPAGCWCAAESYRLPMPMPKKAGRFACARPACAQWRAS